MKPYNHYAPPGIWGPYKAIAHHMGVTTFSINADAVGGTALFSKVRYYKTDVKQVEVEWTDTIKITTGNCVAPIEVCFKGVPLGTAVDGTIDPDGI